MTVFHGQLVILSSPGSQWEWTIPRVLSTLNNMISTGDSISWPTGDIEFPWGTMGVNYSPRALNIEQYGQSTCDDISYSTGDVEFPWGIMTTDRWTWWKIPPGTQRQLTSPGALNIEQYDQFTCHNYFIANWWYWVPLGHNEGWLPCMGALNIEQYGQSTGDDISHSTGDVEFPWGIMTTDHWTWWQNFPGAQWQLTSPGVFNIEQYARPLVIIIS